MPTLTRNHPPVRTFELLRAIRTLLDTPAMGVANGATGRVYLERELSGSPEGSEGEPWGRTVVTSTSTLWPDEHRPFEPRQLGVLVRTEANDIEDAGYDVAVSLEAAQAEIYAELNGWIPAEPNPFTFVRVVMPFYLWQTPDPEPRYDDASGLYYLSSVYRTLVTHVP